MVGYTISPHDNILKETYMTEFFRIFKKLKETKRINPNYKTAASRTHENIKYFDFCRNSVNLFERISNDKQGETHVELMKKLSSL